MFGKGFSHFFISALHFWTKHYKNFLNLYHSTLWLLKATFTATTFSSQIIFYTACFELFGSGLATLTNCLQILF
jgi:hypothetical protein